MKTFFYIAIILFGAFSVSQAQNAKLETIKLATSGAAVTIDGKIDETEWKDALGFDLTGGGRVFFKTDGTHLFVGVRGTQKGWSHLYLTTGENTGSVSVMHASAALGMTVYAPDKNNLWQPANPFAWDLRDRTVTAETGKKMADYLAKNFWTANNNNMSTSNEIEFQVRPRDGNKTLYVAIVYAADAKNPQFFPATLKDDTIKEQLVYGNTPNDLKFDREQWAKIVLEKKTK